MRDVGPDRILQLVRVEKVCGEGEAVEVLQRDDEARKHLQLALELSLSHGADVVGVEVLSVLASHLPYACLLC